MSSEPDSTPRDAGGRSAYDDLGGRVAGILNAAEAAAADIRAEAERAAAELRARAEADAASYTETSRRDADGEAERVISEAAADAAAVRDAVYAAARRIGEEGARTLEGLRADARALESRFEHAVDDLRSLVAQLEDVVLGAADRGAADDASAEAEARPTDPPSLDEELGARVARDSSYS